MQLKCCLWVLDGTQGNTTHQKRCWGQWKGSWLDLESTYPTVNLGLSRYELWKPALVISSHSFFHCELRTTIVTASPNVNEEKITVQAPEFPVLKFLLNVNLNPISIKQWICTGSDECFFPLPCISQEWVEIITCDLYLPLYTVLCFPVFHSDHM